ncbi:SCO-spondin-like isoform X2 [Haliotis rubra]|uniref:SCO-spondin-like isoform X2 n=1 Tax=Haliotis rubra TaxID=36100 RepID=UPI001EE6222A|nr:SCO-spondin-like isoform X2 [Haliotis rubra]
MAGSLPNDGRLSVTVDNQVQRLTIINAQLSDAATYSFTIAGQSRSATITVIAGVLTWTGSQTRTIGGTATITVNLVNGNCNLGTWTRNGGVVSTGGRISYTRSGSCVSHTLTITNVQLSDQGTYQFTYNGQQVSSVLTVSTSAAPVSGGFSAWTPWSQPPCSVTCGTGAAKTVFRSRTCDNPAPLNGGANCTGQFVENVVTNCGLVGCPVNGGVTQWSTWNSGSVTCPQTCGTSAQKITERRRTCTSPTPLNGGTFCGETLLEIRTESCGLTNACPSVVNGGVTEWSSWTNPGCSVSCGTSATKLIQRFRSCTNPPPSAGGADCVENLSDNTMVNCGLTGCPVNGGVNQWGQWSSATCTATCGSTSTYQATRTRQCNNPIPANGGSFCTQPLSETTFLSCGLPACPVAVDGGVSQWTAFNDPGCSVTCGSSATKFITRTRLCNNPPPSNGGRDCETIGLPLVQTNQVNCGLVDCPVAGGVSQWGQWSIPACTVTCGVSAVRTITRTRSCTNPPPSNGGAFCTESLTNTAFQSCGLGACAVNGGLTQWTQWSGPACSVTCGSAATRTLTRTRSCTNPVPHFGGSDCTGQGNTFDSEVRSCGLSECPIDGGLTQWTQWSVPACSVTCGSAASRTVTRTRSCTNPVPQFGGSDCTGQGNTFDSEVRSCGFSQCPINGGLTQWTQWSIPACSVTCGSAASRTVTRTRSCSNPVPQLGGSDCTGQGNTFDSEVRSCGLTPCPTDGGLSTWTQWSVPQCSVTCGQSATRTVTRTRSCTNPVPSDGGRDCTGLGDTFETEQRSCGLNPCPIDGGVTQWTQWNDPACSVTCGAFASKTVTRTRSCTSPTPQFGGRVCTETLFENTVRNCNLAACAVNGGISLWTEWVVPQCLLTCGTSLTETATRQRFCNSPPPSNGGLNCTESRVDTQVRSCGLSSCPVNGGVSQWTTWIESGCGATCGVSIFRTATRQRFCNNPFPAFGGRNCSESFSQTETRNCGFSPCPSMYTKCPSRLCNLPGWSWSSVTHACKRPLTGSGGQTR